MENISSSADIGIDWRLCIAALPDAADLQKMKM